MRWSNGFWMAACLVACIAALLPTAVLASPGGGGTIGALDAAVVMPIPGVTGAVAVEISGTWAGTIIAQVSIDDGTTWRTVDLYNIATAANVANTTANGSFRLTNTAGVARIQIKMSAYTSGTATVTLLATNAAVGIGIADTELPAAAALADNAANPTTPMVGANLLAYDGSTWDRVTNGGGAEATALRVTVANDSTGVLSVDDNGANISVDWAGTVPPIGAGTAAAALRTTLASDDPAVVALQVMDDWDETNRAAVNLISGAVGIAGGTGLDGATVPRVTLATNVGLPAGTSNIGDVDVLTAPGTAADAGALPATTYVTSGYDGANIQVFKTDTGGALQVDIEGGTITVAGAAADGAAVSGSPVRIAGKDGGGLTQDVLTDSGGAIQVDVESVAGTVTVETELPAGGAATPVGVRLSDGAAFYDGTKTGQLPTALVGGRLDVVVGAALPAGTANIGDVDVLTLPALVAGTANIGDVDVLSIAAGDNNIGNMDVASMPADATELPAVSTYSDGLTPPSAPFVQCVLTGFNGTTQDRERGNWTQADALSGAATATRQSASLTNYNATGILITLDVTVASSTDSLTTVNVQAAINAGWITTHSFTLTGIGNSTADDLALLVYPGAATAGSYHVAPAQGIVPRTFRIEIVHGDANSVTYDVDVNFVN